MENIQTLITVNDSERPQEEEIKNYEELNLKTGDLAKLVALANLNRIQLVWPEYKK